GLSGDGSAIGMRITAVRGQQLRDQVVEQEALAELGRARFEVPGAGTLAYRVPGPHRIRIDPVHQLGRDANTAVVAGEPHPILLLEPKRPPERPVHEEPVITKDLTKPGVLRMPRMVPLHRPLGQRVQRERAAVDARFFEGHIPERQWVEIGRDALAMCLGRQYAAMPLAGETEAL